MKINFRKMKFNFRKMKLNFRKMKINFRKMKFNFRELKFNFRKVKFNFRKVKFNFRKMKINFRKMELNSFYLAIMNFLFMIFNITEFIWWEYIGCIYIYIHGSIIGCILYTSYILPPCKFCYIKYHEKKIHNSQIKRKTQLRIQQEAKNLSRNMHKYKYINCNIIGIWSWT